jgi:hypothetical protein
VRSLPGAGTDVMLLKIFSPKYLAKKLAFFAQIKAKLYKNWIITLVFDKKRQLFSPKMAKKIAKIVFITSTPGRYLFPRFKETTYYFVRSIFKLAQ